MNIEDQQLARAVVRRLCSETAAWTDEQLDADPICQWVECLFRKVRDEARALAIEECAKAIDTTAALSVNPDAKAAYVYSASVARRSAHLRHLDERRTADDIEAWDEAARRRIW